MKRPNSGIWWLAAGGLVFFIGIVWTVSSLQRYPLQKQHIERKNADLQRMTALQAEQDRELAAVRMFEALPSTRPPDLTALLRERFPGISAEVRRRETLPARDDWQAQRMEITFDNIALAELGRFLAIVESQRPPWRLIEGNLLAAEQRPGTARATLVFEGLNK